MMAEPRASDVNSFGHSAVVPRLCTLMADYVGSLGRSSRCCAGPVVYIDGRAKGRPTDVGGTPAALSRLRILMAWLRGVLYR